MSKKMLFIYNPMAGKEQIKNKLSEIIQIFCKEGFEVTIFATRGREDATKVIEKKGEKYDYVVCSGGDGTMNEVATGLMKLEKRPICGYIPAGTTNDFASSLHISKNMLEAADTVVNGVPFACDVGVFNQDYFVYIAAFGLFTDVSYETKQSMKNVLGHLAYILEGTKRIFNIPSYRIKVTHDGETIEDEFIYGMVTNSRSVGGFKGITGKNVVFDDGKFEVTLFKTPRNPMELNEILGALALRKINPKRMYSFKTNEVHFETEEEIPWTLDGEFGGVHVEVVVKDCQKALEIMVKPEVIEDVSEKKGTE